MWFLIWCLIGRWIWSLDLKGTEFLLSLERRGWNAWMIACYLASHIKGHRRLGANFDCSISFSTFSFSFCFRVLPLQTLKLESYSVYSIFPLCQELSILLLVFLYNQRNCPSRGHLACSPPPHCKCSLAQTARCYERLHWSRPLPHKEIEKKSPWLRSLSW